MKSKGKVILFGKTGSGKSTIANALVTGNEGDQVFGVSAGFRGCTSSLQTASGRGWEVVDTIGLGESTTGTVSSEDEENMILEFLKNVKNNYSHIIYVKSGAERFTIMDEKIWAAFTSVFEGAEESFIVLITHKNQRWLNTQWDDGSLPKWIRDLGKNRVFITSLPPVDEDEETEKEYKIIRDESLATLEIELERSFAEREYKYSSPTINQMNESQLR